MLHDFMNIFYDFMNIKIFYEYKNIIRIIKLCIHTYKALILFNVKCRVSIHHDTQSLILNIVR